MSDPATDRILAKAAEETATRNAVAAVADARQANLQAAQQSIRIEALAAQIVTLGNQIGVLNKTFAAAMQKVVDLEGTISVLADRLDTLEKEAGDAAHD
jgi:hypothetical protein